MYILTSTYVHVPSVSTLWIYLWIPVSMLTNLASENVSVDMSYDVRVARLTPRSGIVVLVLLLMVVVTRRRRRERRGGRAVARAPSGVPRRDGAGARR